MDPAESLRASLHALDSVTLDRLHNTSMLLTGDYTEPELLAISDLARVFEQLDRAGVATPLFPNELAYALFFDSSTRTKSAWAGATARLGSDPVIVDGSSTQVEHGETAEETGAMLGMNCHALGIRHDLILGQGNSFMRAAQKGIDDYLKATDDTRVVPIVNLQCDIDHPTQAMADLVWLRQRFGDNLAGRTIAVSWAYSPSYAKPLSVPQGLITLLTRFGMNVRLAHPKGYDLIDNCMQRAGEQAKASGGSFETFDDMDAAFQDADIVYPKSWGPFDLMTERVAANQAKDTADLQRIEQAALQRNAQFRDWICNEDRMARTKEGNALYMHCLPADIGSEVTPGIMQKARVDLAREANKKVYVIMALLASAKQRGLVKRLGDFVEGGAQQ